MLDNDRDEVKILSVLRRASLKDIVKLAGEIRVHEGRRCRRMLIRAQQMKSPRDDVIGGRGGGIGDGHCFILKRCARLWSRP